MRQILFKAKRIDNGEWVEGFLFHCLNNGEEWCIGKAPLSANDYSEIIGEYVNWFPIDENTICQYTGLTDKNDNKIWEGDVLTDDDMFSVVRWNEEEARFVIDDYGTKGCLMEYGFDECMGEYGVVDTYGFDDFCSMKSFEVIGNIFDNPELLER